MLRGIKKQGKEGEGELESGQLIVFNSAIRVELMEKAIHLSRT